MLTIARCDNLPPLPHEGTEARVGTERLGEQGMRERGQAMAWGRAVWVRVRVRVRETQSISGKRSRIMIVVSNPFN